MTSREKANDLDVEYQDFGKHLVRYAKMKDRLYIAEMEELIVTPTVRWKQDEKVDGRLARFGLPGGDSRNGEAKWRKGDAAHFQVRFHIFPEWQNGD